jgi:hypothetical protein
MLSIRERRLRPQRSAVAFASAFTFALALLIPQGRDQAHALPAGLPNHFGFGVSAGQGDTWMPQSGVAWDYRFQYLVGGVNTGSGWETWNTNGTFALNYAQESAQRGLIPMFPYYELLQSSGSCGGCNENQKDLTNLNTTSLMLAYYQNFALLMKRLGPGTYDNVPGFGKPALINIEPDFSGGYAVQAVNNNSVCFGLCTGQGNDPSLLRAAVASSGFADAATYPNTYAGYMQALAHLRDLYAPNVMLGLEVSPWATGIDVGTDSSPNLNSAALGQQVGAFLSKAGGHEVLFNNPLDRDAGQYKVQFGQNRWWDRLNVAFPNFVRWESYLAAAASADGGKSTFLWQVPVGNQYYDTENNTNGHFQDNRAEYIFSHISELIQAGIVGVMFAPGNSGSTSYTDTMKDGVTNPSSFCTTDGTSSGQICNTHVSSVADDDGGFIRTFGHAYYTHPVPLSGGAPATSTPTLARTPTSTFTPTATRTSTPTATATPKSTNTQADGYRCGGRYRDCYRNARGAEFRYVGRCCAEQWPTWRDDCPHRVSPERECVHRTGRHRDLGRTWRESLPAVLRRAGLLCRADAYVRGQLAGPADRGARCLHGHCRCLFLRLGDAVQLERECRGDHGNVVAGGTQAQHRHPEIESIARLAEAGHPRVGAERRG